VKEIKKEEVILSFLLAGLIDVNGDDEKLNKLQVAAKGLAKSLNKNTDLALLFVLAASNPAVREDDPSIVTSLESLEEVWKTYRNAFLEAPILVARAILLEALVGAMETNDHIALVVASCVRNMMPHREMGSEQDVWGRVLFTAELQVDKRAVQDWATPSEIKLPAINFGEIEPINIGQGEVSIDTDDLKYECAKAVGQQYHKTTGAIALEGGNPHMQHNSSPHFTKEFGQIMSEVLSSTITAAFESAAIPEVDLAEPMARITDELSSFLSGSFQSYSAATSGLERRTNLLWWKEALFSKSIGESYRSLPPGIAAALMAVDLFNELPCFSPASVTAFLQEAVIKLPDLDMSKTYSLAELVEDIKNEPKLISLRETSGQLIPEQSDCKLLVSLLSVNASPTSGDQAVVAQWLGVSEDTKLTVPDWARWLLGDLLALQAASLGTQRKGKRKAA